MGETIDVLGGEHRAEDGETEEVNSPARFHAGQGAELDCNDKDCHNENIQHGPLPEQFKPVEDPFALFIPQPYGPDESQSGQLPDGENEGEEKEHGGEEILLLLDKANDAGVNRIGALPENHLLDVDERLREPLPEESHGNDDGQRGVKPPRMEIPE